MLETKKYGLSISHRLLIAFLSIFIIGCSALTITYYLFSRNSISRYANEAVIRELESINDTFRNTIQKTLIRELRLLSANPLLDEFLISSESTRDINARALERLFLQEIKYVKEIEKIRFVDSRGMERVAVSKQGRIREYRSLREEPFFLEIEASPPGSITQTNLFPDSNDNKLFSIAIHKTDPDIGEFGGAIIVDYNLAEFFAFAKKIVIFEENPVWIFSPSGLVLTKPSNPLQLDPRPFTNHASSKNITIYGLHGGLVATSDLAIINDSPLMQVCISIPEKLLYQDIQQVLRFLAIVFAVSLFLLVIAVFFVSRYLSSPLIMLANAVQKLAKESFSKKIDIHATGEVGFLVDSFNNMANDLRKTTVSKEYVDRIFQAMTNSLIVLDSEGFIESVNSATLSLLGYETNELIGQPFSIITTGTFFTES